MPDQYEINARLVPSILCSAPFALISFYFLGQIKTPIWGSILAISVGGVGMTYALYQLAKHTCRFFGKRLEEWAFKDGIKFPTTRFLLDDDTTYSSERKAELRAKIKVEFGIDLGGHTADTEANRRRIHEVVGQIRRKFFKKDNLALQRNIQFGFWRNLTGGCFLAVTVSVIAIILGIATGQHVAVVLSLIFLCTYASVLFGSYFAMKLCAKYYALALFDEFLAS